MGRKWRMKVRGGRKGEEWKNKKSREEERAGDAGLGFRRTRGGEGGESRAIVNS